jgi:barbiturase
MPQPIEVRKVPLEKVNDASGLEELINKGVFEADDVLAVVGKTEGNGGVNDYTRILADRAFREVLAARGTRSWEEIMQIPLACSARTPPSSPGSPPTGPRPPTSPGSRSASP